MKHIFREIKNLAEKQLADQHDMEIILQKVMITIPFQYKEWHKQQMIDACTLAGFTSSHFIYEPVAATLAFGLNKKQSWFVSEKRAVVFGFGGNSVRATIVGIKEFVKIIKSVRSQELSGNILDRKMFKELQRRLREAHPDLFDEYGKSQYDSQLYRKAQDLKKRLSKTDKLKTLMQLDIAQNYQFNITFTRDDFEKLAQGIIKGCIELLQTTLMEAETPAEIVSDVILVGGGTRIPLLRN